MPAERVQRRLAAIVAVDVVGFSRLMEADEAGTLAALKDHRAATEPISQKYSARLVGTAGDGQIWEFASVVDAVTCSVEVQAAIAARNAGVPEDKRVAFRVGVNLGDVIIDGDDILGDGVNVAARLEGLAEPGGVCVSGNVHEQVAGKTDLAFDDMGEQKVKNIKRPVRAYWVRLDGSDEGKASAAANQTATLELPDKPSIAVLPFDNLSSDPEQEYFSDGITEDIITELSRNRELLVIARNSSFAYKGEATDVKQIAGELGVRYVLEGSVRRGGDRVRITAQLIDAQTGSHLWAERYDRDLENIFEIQDEITRTIAGNLGASVTEAERSRAMRKAPASLDAYDHTQRAWALYLRLTKPGNEEARSEANAAIAIDPTYAAPYAMLAATYFTDVFSGWTDDPLGSLEKARDTAGNAVSLDSMSDFAHAILSMAELWLRNHDRAVTEGRRAVELNPNNADAHVFLATSLNFVGRPEESLSAIQTGKRLNPHQPSWYIHIEGRSYFMLERYDEAVRVEESVTTVTPGFTMGVAILAASYAALGRTHEAKAAVDKILDIAPSFTLAYVPRAAPYKNPEDLEIFLKWLRKAGLPE